MTGMALLAVSGVPAGAAPPYEGSFEEPNEIPSMTGDADTRSEVNLETAEITNWATASEDTLPTGTNPAVITDLPVGESQAEMWAGVEDVVPVPGPGTYRITVTLTDAWSRDRVEPAVVTAAGTAAGSLWWWVAQGEFEGIGLPSTPTSVTDFQVVQVPPGLTEIEVKVGVHAFAGIRGRGRASTVAHGVVTGVAIELVE